MVQVQELLLLPHLSRRWPHFVWPSRPLRPRRQQRIVQQIKPQSASLEGIRSVVLCNAPPAKLALPADVDHLVRRDAGRECETGGGREQSRWLL